ncbi:MAG: diaminopropionate ammonia-lyase [Acidobacteria bacterium]|nr:diaminopropionate ammonia-lyase [Acidobacteriota bacterium]
MEAAWLNPRERCIPTDPVISSKELGLVEAFYGARPELKPTPLHRLRGIAEELSLGEVLIKDESSRFGLNAFKILGVLYAFHRIMESRVSNEAPIVVCASAGNHGRAVAWAAREFGFTARVYLPVGTAPARVDAIANEGADVVVTDVGYEGSIRRVVRDAEREGWLIISDTSWPGYDEVPRWIMAGYTWMMAEAQAQWSSVPDVVIVQGGVGGLVCAGASWFAQHLGTSRPFFIAAEPTVAPCLLESARIGRPTVVTEHDTMMACLKCAEISPIIWPVLADAVDAVVTIDDERAAWAMRRLAHPSAGDPEIVAGASGACGLGALQAIMSHDVFQSVRDRANLGPQSSVLVVNTEGATDPTLYRSIVSD